MEWLILLLLAPAIVVPVVLLCGFAGCGFEPQAVTGGGGTTTVTVMPPTGVIAEPKNVDHITVSWHDPEVHPKKYHVVRNPGTMTEKTFDVDSPTTVFEDSPWHAAPDYTPLDAATEYTYQVSTTTADGTSDPSMMVPARTFQPAFKVDPATVPTNQPGFMGDYCFVQVISAGRLLASGTKVGIKVRGAPGSNVTIKGIYISQVANTYDSAGDLTAILPSTSPPLTLSDAQPIDLEPIDYNLDKSKDLIIAFDFTGAPSSDTISYLPEPGVKLHYKQGVKQAAQNTRDPGYLSPVPFQLYLVATIGVPVP